jgi:hypothetical protein
MSSREMVREKVNRINEKTAVQEAERARSSSGSRDAEASQQQPNTKKRRADGGAKKK